MILVSGAWKQNVTSLPSPLRESEAHVLARQQRHRAVGAPLHRRCHSQIRNRAVGSENSLRRFSAGLNTLRALAVLRNSAAGWVLVSPEQALCLHIGSQSVEGGELFGAVVTTSSSVSPGAEIRTFSTNATNISASRCPAR
jgi:hypothetical protein